MKCEIHGCEMDYMGEVMGQDIWSCPACVDEDEYEFNRCPLCGEQLDDCLCDVHGMLDEDETE
jgi:hypothetical protein